MPLLPLFVLENVIIFHQRYIIYINIFILLNEIINNLNFLCEYKIW